MSDVPLAHFSPYTLPTSSPTPLHPSGYHAHNLHPTPGSSSHYTMHRATAPAPYPDTSVMPGSYNPSPNASPRALHSFTHEELLKVGNHAYTSLFHRFNTLQAAYDQLVAGLAINRSSTAPGRSSSPLPPAPVLPPCPPFKVRFMTRQSFKDAYGRETTNIVKYFEGAQGEQLSKERIGVICRIIHRFWRALGKKGMLPEKWGQIDGTALEWLKAQVYTLCPELRFCLHDWKLLFYCQGHYSSWRSQNILKRTASDVDDDESGGEPVRPKPAKRRRPNAEKQKKGQKVHVDQDTKTAHPPFEQMYSLDPEPSSPARGSPPPPPLPPLAAASPPPSSFVRPHPPTLGTAVPAPGAAMPEPSAAASAPGMVTRGPGSVAPASGTAAHATGRTAAATPRIRAATSPGTAAPAARPVTPATNTAAPAQHAAAPAPDAAALAPNAAALAPGMVAPSVDSALALAPGTAAPVLGLAAPAPGTAAPVLRTTVSAPRMAAPAPATNTAASAQHAATPGPDPTVLAPDAAALTPGMVAPGVDATAAPALRTAAPVLGPAAPALDTAAPAPGTTVSAPRMTAPAPDTTSPAPGTTAPPLRMAAPAAGATAPPASRRTAPALGATAPEPRTAATASGKTAGGADVAPIASEDIPLFEMDLRAPLKRPKPKPKPSTSSSGAGASRSTPPSSASQRTVAPATASSSMTTSPATVIGAIADTTSVPATSSPPTQPPALDPAPVKKKSGGYPYKKSMSAKNMFALDFFKPPRKRSEQAEFEAAWTALSPEQLKSYEDLSKTRKANAAQATAKATARADARRSTSPIA